MSQESPPIATPLTIPGLESKELNLALALAPAVQPPFSGDCARFSSSCSSLVKVREKLYTKLGHFLFGAEDSLDRWSNDFGEAIRQSIVGQWASSWLGSAPDRPGPHAKLSGEQRDGEFMIDVEHFHDEADARVGPVSSEALTEVDHVRFSAHHLYVDVEGGEGYTDPVACSDFGLEVATGSHANLISLWIEQGWRVSKLLCWLAADYGHPTVLKARIQETFANTLGVLKRIVDWKEFKFSKKLVSSRTQEVSVKVPLDLTEAAKHYRGIADLLHVVNPFKAVTRSAGGSGTLCEVSFKDYVFEASFYIRSGELAYREEVAGLVEWDKEGQLVVETTVDCTLVPLGPSAVSVPLPHMTLQTVMERRGRLVVTCIDAGEPEYKMAADTLFDTALFRQQLLEKFRVEIEHFPSDGPSERPAVKTSVQFMFPTSTVATIISQWFYTFALQQLGDADSLQLVADLIGALSMDGARILATSAI